MHRRTKHDFTSMHSRKSEKYENMEKVAMWLTHGITIHEIGLKLSKMLSCLILLYFYLRYIKCGLWKGSWNKCDLRTWMYWKSCSSLAMTRRWCCNSTCLISVTSTLSSCTAVLYMYIILTCLIKRRMNIAIWTYTDSLGLPGRGASGISPSLLSNSAGVSSAVRSIRSTICLQSR